MTHLCFHVILIQEYRWNHLGIDNRVISEESLGQNHDEPQHLMDKGK